MDKKKIRDGLKVFRRPNSSKWQAHIRQSSGKWIYKSTKQSDFDKAVEVAKEEFNKIRYLQEQGEIAVTRKFKSVAIKTKQDLQQKLDDGTGKKAYVDYIAAIDNYLIPCLGKYDVHTINAKRLDELEKFRADKLKKTPAKSTINNHNAALNTVFETALDQGFMRQVDKPLLKNTGRKTEARPWFEQEEVHKLINFLRQNEKFKKSTNTKTHAIRELLRDYCQILLNTGIRPGEEALNIKWKNIKMTSQGLLITVNGKTGKRELVPRDFYDGVSKPLERIKNRFDGLKDLTPQKLYKRNEFVFRLPDGTKIEHERLAKNFKVALKKGKLLEDSNGDCRTLYSLRHTYATKEIISGRNIHLLARQMGTSVKMLEDHYSHFQARMNYEEFSGEKESARQKVSTSQKDETKKLKKRVEELEEQLRDKNTIIEFYKEKQANKNGVEN